SAATASSAAIAWVPSASASCWRVRLPVGSGCPKTKGRAVRPPFRTVVTLSTYDDQNLAHPLGNSADPESALMPDPGWRVPLVPPAPTGLPSSDCCVQAPFANKERGRSNPQWDAPILGRWLNASTKLALWERFSRCLWQKYNRAWQALEQPA